MLEKTYDPKTLEPAAAEAWEKADAFAALRDDRRGKESYCIVIPPPNVTGSLHMGHALDNTLQDILIRTMRMRGKDVLWQAGTDHAGIATQLVVERHLAANGEPRRRDLGREEFLKRVWSFKEQSGEAIINQLKRLGCSCDWSRQRFTLDEGLTKAVIKVFVELHRKGLIYKDKRLVNWDPKLQTAVSDLEVEHIEKKGHLWHFFYPLADDPEQGIVVATTRPETMLGDSCVAVNGEDERYQHLIGKHLRLPLVGRLIPIVADEHADPEVGAGAVKITPAHDFNDFEVGKRHGAAQISILDLEAQLDLAGNEAFLAEVAPSAELDETLAMHGLDRFAARKAIVARMEALGFLRETEAIKHTIPFDEKSKSVVIEPMLTDQWYVDAETLAKPALAAVKEGRTKIVPANWEKTYYEWMENIQPWCISRQLWWGHRIPAWYGPDGETFVAYDQAEAEALARAHYGEDRELHQDEDVLDTWFSSALWPFSTLGWPDDTEAMKRYYPTSVLVTGFDIIFFWVARMMMMGLEFTGKEPFDTVYLHALVRDEKGQKMSKTRGNVIDPLEVIDQYGADALRFTLTIFAAQGRDIKLAVSRVEGYRNFATKLWNAARFAEMNGVFETNPPTLPRPNLSVNRWLVGEVERCLAAVDKGIAAYRFNDAASALYRFVWNSLCDWYVEISKSLLGSADEGEVRETRETFAWALDETLKMLHPFMPYLTEELWRSIGAARQGREHLLMLTDWPTWSGLAEAEADEEMNWLTGLIGAIRSTRAEMNVPASLWVPLQLVGLDAKAQGWLEVHRATIERLARVKPITEASDAPEGSVEIALGDMVAALALKGLIDFDAECARLDKEAKKVADETAKLKAKLSNEQFLAKAPANVIDEQNQRLSDLEAKGAQVAAARAKFG